MSEPKVITVTLNPSLDRTVVVHHLAIGYQNRTVGTTRLDPAGRGMNISRALSRLERRTHGILLLGDDAIGRAYEALILEEAFPISIARRQGRTRSNTIIMDTGDGSETHLIEESEGVPQESFEFVVETLRKITTPDDIVVYAGELPAEAYATTYAWLTGIAHELGAQAVLVTSGEPLELALETKPDLVMLRQVEVEALFNRPVRVYEDVVACAEEMRARGADRVLIITGEESGAALVTPDGRWLVDLPELEKGTLSGVADALLAGYLAGRVDRLPLDETLELAAASAAYTSAHPGNEFGTLDEVESLAEQEDITIAEDDRE